MRWLLVVVGLVGGCGSSGGGAKAIDAQVTPDQCEATFESAIDRACGSAGDCALLAHDDCCGELEIGVRAASLADAMAANQTYGPCENAACGARGCQHATESEDHMVPQTGQTIVAVCVSQRCTSTVQ